MEVNTQPQYWFQVPPVPTEELTRIWENREEDQAPEIDLALVEQILIARHVLEPTVEPEISALPVTPEEDFVDYVTLYETKTRKPAQSQSKNYPQIGFESDDNETPEIKKALVWWGVGLILTGSLSLLLGTTLSRVMASVLILLGALNFVAKRTWIFIFNGLVLFIAGISNLAGIIQTAEGIAKESPMLQIFWLLVGGGMMLYAFNTFMKYQRSFSSR
jgi:hypothetical protein